jgi:hypothetical protein
MCVHLAAAAGAYAAGRWALAPGTFGDGGIASFASDGRIYRLQIVALERTLKEEGAAAWLGTPAPVHVKLYSLSFALFSPLFGQTVLSVEPLNLIYYLATLLLVYASGSEAFGRREGLLAAWMTAALLPSFLLHTTQLLKDPLFVVLALALVLVSLKWLTTRYTLRGGLVAGALGGVASGALWLVRDSMWVVMLAVMLLGAGLCVVQQVRRRAMVAGNLAGIALMLAAGLSVRALVAPYYLPREYWEPAAVAASRAGKAGGTMEGSTPQAAAAAHAPDGRPRWPWAQIVARIADKRSQFGIYEGAESNLDAHVRFDSASDVIRYLPRAALIGLCAPFPRMWFGAGGQVGSAGRLLSGGETFLMYVVQTLALVSLWHRRRQPPAWLLVTAALIGVTALGIVVVNVGALYRMRYLFWMLFIIAGAATAARMLPARFGARPDGAGAADGRLV